MARRALFRDSPISLILLSFFSHVDELRASADERQRALEVDRVYGVGVLDLDAVTQQIDETSRTVLDPESVSESRARRRHPPTDSSSASGSTAGGGGGGSTSAATIASTRIGA